VGLIMGPLEDTQAHILDGEDIKVTQDSEDRDHRDPRTAMVDQAAILEATPGSKDSPRGVQKGGPRAPTDPLKLVRVPLHMAILEVGSEALDQDQVFRHRAIQHHKMDPFPFIGRKDPHWNTLENIPHQILPKSTDHHLKMDVHQAKMDMPLPHQLGHLLSMDEIPQPLHQRAPTQTPQVALDQRWKVSSLLGVMTGGLRVGLL